MILTCFIIAAGVLGAYAKSGVKDSNAKYVNPLLGTAGAVEIGGYGGTIPSTNTPFAMTHFTAMTQENYVSGCPYVYWQTTFYGFLASHQPAKWMVRTYLITYALLQLNFYQGESGEAAISFGINEVKPAYKDRGLKFNHSAETSTVSYYSVYLQDEINKKEIFAELSGKSRAGILRLTFPEDSTPYTVIQVTRKGFQGEITVDHKRKEIYGYNPERQDSKLGPDKAASFKGYFVARFEEDFDSYGIAYDSSLFYNTSHGQGEVLSAFVTFPQGTKQVHLKMGVSYISIEQARYNLDLEIPDTMTLEDVSEYTWNQWSEKLDTITVYNATNDQKEMLYSAMFHSLQVINKHISLLSFLLLTLFVSSSMYSFLMKCLKSLNPVKTCIIQDMMIKFMKVSLIRVIVSGIHIVLNGLSLIY